MERNLWTATKHLTVRPLLQPLPGPLVPQYWYWGCWGKQSCVTVWSVDRLDRITTSLPSTVYFIILHLGLVQLVWSLFWSGAQHWASADGMGVYRSNAETQWLLSDQWLFIVKTDDIYQFCSDLLVLVLHWSLCIVLIVVMAFMLTCTIDMYVTSCLLFCLFLSNKLTFVRLLSVNMHCLVFSVFDSGVWTPCTLIQWCSAWVVKCV